MPLTGGTVTGQIVMQGAGITLPNSPSSPTDAANKAYVDSIVPSGANATLIQGVAVDPTSPSGGQVLTYNSGTGKYVPQNGAGIGGSPVVDTQVVGNGSAYVSQPTAIIDLRNHVVSDGATDNTNTINALVSAQAGKQVAFLVPANTAVGNLSTSANVTLDFSSGGDIHMLQDATSPGGGSFVTPGGGQANESATSCSATASISAGDAIFFGVKQYTSWSYLPTGLPSDGTVTFRKVAESNVGYPQYISGYIASNLSSGSHTVTINYPSAVKVACIAVPMHGVGKFPAVDTFVYNNSMPASATMTTPAATVQAGDFAIAWGGQDYNNGGCAAAGAGFSSTVNALSVTSSTQTLCSEYLASTSAGSLTATQTMGGSATTYAYGLITFRPGNASISVQGGIHNPDHHQIFYGGPVDFTYNKAITEVYPEWFGASVNASASTNTTALQNAVYAAFGCGPAMACRSNGTGLNVYNRPLKICQMFSINGELQFYHVNNFEIEGCGKLGSGITQTATNSRIIDGQNIAYGTIHDLAFSGTASSTKPLIDIDNDHTHGNDLSPQHITFKDMVFSGSGLVDVGVLISKHGGDAQGDNIRCEYCYFNGFTGAGWQIGGNNTGRNVGRFYAQNAIKVQLKGGDMQGNPLYGAAVYGGSIELDGISMENDSAGLGTQTGYDLYCEAPQDACIMRNVRSESHKLAAGQPIRIINSRTMFQAQQWDIANIGGTSWPTNYCCIAGSSIGGDGKYYKVTTGGVFGGLSNTTATSGSATGVGVASATWTFSAFVGYRLTLVSGTGAGHYCLITANDATSLTCSGGWLTQFYRLPQANPDSTTHFVVEPNWGTQTTSGAATFALFDFNAIDGAPAGGKVSGGSLIEDVAVFGGKLAVGSSGAVLHRVQVSRSDWLDTSGQGFPLDGLFFSNRYDQVTINRVSVYVPATATTYYPGWSFPRLNGTAKYAANSWDQRQDAIVWSTGSGLGTGPALDAWIGGRSDSGSTTDIFRGRLEYGGLLGPPAPDPSLGSNLNGAPARIGGGSSTGSGTPGAIEFWCGSSGASGVQINSGALCWLLGGATTNLIPNTDNASNLGDPTHRVATGYFGTSAISPLFNATTGYQVGGSYGTSGQCLVSTGTGSNWAACTSGANAAQLQGVAISASAPSDTNLLGYSASGSQWQPVSAIPESMVTSLASDLDL